MNFIFASGDQNSLPLDVSDRRYVVMNKGWECRSVHWRRKIAQENPYVVVTTDSVITYERDIMSAIKRMEATPSYNSPRIYKRCIKPTELYCILVVNFNHVAVRGSYEACLESLANFSTEARQPTIYKHLSTRRDK